MPLGEFYAMADAASRAVEKMESDQDTGRTDSKPKPRRGSYRPSDVSGENWAALAQAKARAAGGVR
jgi:hypothetical protein